ncbi:palmitoyltransferase ZDHHC3-like [Gigantopelta aegis]|uniref:palmitoyltransferase ZDHHC3-like n=1 Tax=Gigantopelta aegis TaxID=1735272 RepID=UPI001B887514|nr:palmitoyltransferase ZDHHC3-like [Gigantopelta aegis]
MVVFRSDPCGITCIIFTYIAVLYADYVVIRHLIIPSMAYSLWGAFHVVVFNTILFLLIISHLRAVLSDPGIVPLPTANIDFSDMHSGNCISKSSDGWTVCMKCETYRPPRAHHCRVCRRCIRRMDHHCPWINNCVGEYNQKFFMQFLFYVGVSSLYAVAMVITAWVLDPAPVENVRHIKLLHSIILVIESILFGLFVMAIGCDQVSSILNDETAVEHVKREGHRRYAKTKFALFQEVFGRGHPLAWLCPVQFQPVSMETPLQYRV